MCIPRFRVSFKFISVHRMLAGIDPSTFVLECYGLRSLIPPTNFLLIVLQITCVSVDLYVFCITRMMCWCILLIFPAANRYFTVISSSP
jgi:hypothetical protein